MGSTVQNWYFTQIYKLISLSCFEFAPADKKYSSLGSIFDSDMDSEMAFLLIWIQKQQFYLIWIQKWKSESAVNVYLAWIRHRQYLVNTYTESTACLLKGAQA